MTGEFEALGTAVLKRLGRTAGRVREATPLEADLLQSEDAYLAVFDAPGAREEDVNVRVEDGALRVRIDRFREFREGYEMRYPGRGLSLSGEVDLPDDANPAAADATLKRDGTLHVRLPKRAGGERATSVPVESAGDEDGDEDESDA